MTELLAPLRADPRRAAAMFDVDGTLAPIVRHADDAAISEATRSLLTAIARRYGLVACISGRRASDTRRIVSIGSIAYVGSHGGELLPPGGVEPRVDPELRGWQRRVQAFAREADDAALARLRVRLEDKGPIAAFHWRGAPDEAAAAAAVEQIARDAEQAGFHTHWGRKVLEVRPPVRIDKGIGVQTLLRGADVDAALYVGDDNTDLDAFRALGDLVEQGRLRTALRIGVRSDEGPAEIEQEADVVVDGPAGVQRLLEALTAP
ncbi:MAG: trehalose 6-phosphate phosphatase [Solirubrobacteraceae bacterium]|jgi:trehalose 6-phosphate phosphatase|nr:trehalose 6-phosphate phosphatase [Solirubrobacteraceae bacterium]